MRSCRPDVDAPAWKQIAPRLLGAAALAALGACESDGPRRISESGFGAFEVSLAVQPDRIAVAWYDTRDGNAEIYLRLLDGEGRPTGVEHRLTDDAQQSYEVDIDPIGDGFAVAWYDKDSASVLRAKLGLWQPELGFEWRIDLTPPGRSSRNPVAGVLSDRIFCAWIEQNATGGENVLAAWWDVHGNALGSPTVLGPAGPTTWNLNAALDVDGRAYVVFDAAVDTAKEELYLARVDHPASGSSATGGPAGTPARVEGSSGLVRADHATVTLSRPDDATGTLARAAGREVRLDVADDSTAPLARADDSTAALARADDATRDLARDDSSASTLVRLTADDGHASKYPDLTLSGHRAALTWFDLRDGNREVYLFAGTLDELHQGIEAHARRISHTPGQSIGAYVAWNGERIGLAWSDQLDGPHDVRFQSFDDKGEPLGAIRRITRTPTRSSIPAIRPWRSGFAIAWNEVDTRAGGVHDASTRSEVDLVLLP